MIQDSSQRAYWRSGRQGFPPYGKQAKVDDCSRDQPKHDLKLELRRFCAFCGNSRQCHRSWSGVRVSTKSWMAGAYQCESRLISCGARDAMQCDATTAADAGLGCLSSTRRLSQHGTLITIRRSVQRPACRSPLMNDECSAAAETPARSSGKVSFETNIHTTGTFASLGPFLDMAPALSRGYSQRPSCETVN